MKRRRYSREQWLEWQVEQVSSGQSISNFCKQKQVSENSFYAWRRKLDAELKTSQPSTPFVPLSIVGGEQLEVDMPCGATIRVPSDELSVRRILAILLELGGPK